MKDIYEAIESRVKSPLFAYLLLSFIGFNWKAFFFLFIDQGSVDARILYFESHTSILSLLIYPFLTAAIYSAIHPWITYFFLRISNKPTELKNSLQASSEHKLLTKRGEYEGERQNLKAQAEERLISIAKNRDQELRDIADPDVRENLKEEIEELRNTSAGENKYNDSVFKSYERLMGIADDLRERARAQGSQSDEFWNYEQQANAMEAKANALLGLESK